MSVVKGFFGSFVVRGAAVLSKRVWGRSRALQPVLSYLTLSAVRLLRWSAIGELVAGLAAIGLVSALGILPPTQG